MHPLFAAVLQGDFGVHSNHFIARINGFNHIRIAPANHVSPHFFGARQLAVISIQFLVQQHAFAQPLRRRQGGINGDNFAAGIGFVQKTLPEFVNLAKKFPTGMLFARQTAGILYCFLLGGNCCCTPSSVTIAQP